MTKRQAFRGRRVISNERYAHENENYKRIWRINEAIRNEDVETLRSIGRDGGGFINNSLRRRVWPVLLQCNNVVDLEDTEDDEKEEHVDEKQVQLDVDRSLNAYPQGLDEISKKKKQDELNELIVEVLRRNKSLHYYQGFHDICTVFLLIFGKNAAVELVEQVTLFYLRDAMLESMDPILRQVTLLDTIYQHEDQQISNFLQEANVLPYYCLSWVITWCSHDIDDFSVIPRLFDLFLSSNPLMPVYFAAAIVLAHKEELLQQECENSAIHTFLSKLPQKPFDVELLIGKATQLEVTYPPIQLQRNAQIGLDETSSVNTWCNEKSVAEARDQARRIFRMEPSERRPLAVVPTYPKQEQKVRQMIAILTAVGIGVAAAALATSRYV
ncbi:rab-GTPase-TBC domain-containing protein [Umbelopsis sp. PMI_123]|nr:rab-GTPase-TBC domain-containing protein [Umbelopsis sp. PMI_123]